MRRSPPPLRHGWPDVTTSNYYGDNASALLNDHFWIPLGGLSVSIDDVTVTEGNTGSVSETVTVRLSVAYDEPVTVHYVTAAGSATPGSDYAAAAGTCWNFPAARSSPAACRCRTPLGGTRAGSGC